MKYSKMSLSKIIDYCRAKGKEGDFWDFKLQWHDKTADLLKDIICLANTAHDENGYLVFGIADDLSVKGVSGIRRKQADIIDAISNLVFAGDNIPQISVETITYQGSELDVLIIYDTDKTPIYLKKTYGNMRQGCIYARVGDRNTPDNGNAEIGVIENLWRKRFGLMKPPLEFLFDTLEKTLDWTESMNGYYHIYRPEYTIERVNEDDLDLGKGADDFYSYTQTNEATSYYMLDVKAKGTTLERFQIVNLDSGRLSIPVPEWGYVSLEDQHHDTIGYKFYIKDSHREKLLRFMYDPNDGEQRWAFNNFVKIILFFRDDDEYRCFERFLGNHRNDIKQRVDQSDAYDYIKTESKVKTENYKTSLRVSIVLKEMLKEFREIDN